jgi:hypothetical protein
MPKLNKKNFILWLCSRKESPLKFSENLLYSYLAWRPGGSLRQMAAATGLDRCKSVARLRKLGLMAETEYAALMPPEGWFIPRKSNDSDWRKQILYCPISIRQSELTAKQNALFAAIKWRPLKRLSWYATCLKLNRSGMYKTLNELRRKKFVAPDCLAVRTDAKDIWKDIDNSTFVTDALKSKFPPGYEPVIAWELADLWRKVDHGSEQLLTRTKWYNRKYVSGYWDRVVKMLPRPEHLDVFIWEFAKLVDYVVANAKTGGFLTSTTSIACEQIIRTWHQTIPGSRFLWNFEPTTLGKV